MNELGMKGQLYINKFRAHRNDVKMRAQSNIGKILFTIPWLGFQYC